MKRNSKNPRVSIVIVNWNGKKYLQKCLVSLGSTTYKNIEIIVVDQCSIDGSVELVRQKFPKIKLICNSDNTGYVGGNNLGAQNATGKYLLILNNDIEVTSGFLEPLVSAFEKDPKLGVAQPKAINKRFKGTLDGGGSFLTWTGFLYHKGYLEKHSNPEFSATYPVYSVKGAYMMTRRELFLKLGGLDRDFFIYFEETDYCGRVWISGYTVKYIGDSVVYHWGGSDTKKDWEKRFALVQYRSFKNRICSYIKNLSGRKLVILLSIHLLMSEVGSLYYLLRGRFGASLAIQKALLWNFFHLKKTLKKRRYIQDKLRKVSDDKIFLHTKKNIEFMYYFQQAALLARDRS